MKTFHHYTFLELVKIWLHSKKNIKIQSYQKYENIIENYISNENLFNSYIKKINKEDIKNYFNQLKLNNLSISTQKTILYIIKSSIQYAYNNSYCNFIDLSEIKLKNLNESIYIFSKEEQIKIEKYLNEDINIRKLCLLLCLYTGLRIGEVCGLKWEDFNFNTNSFRVIRTIERIKNTNEDINTKTILISSSPKSYKSNRVIPIPSFLINYLKLLKKEDDFYLLSSSTKMYDPRLLEGFYERVLKKCNIHYVKFHTLRHTFATRCIESNMDVKTLSEILGHSTVEITLKLYVHPSYEMKRLSIENLVNYMINY